MDYLRTSSAANVGADKDSERRQGEAIGAFAGSIGNEIVEGCYDAAVSGVDAITARPGFSAMLERLLSNGVRAILVETASRFEVRVWRHDFLPGCHHAHTPDYVLLGSDRHCRPA